VPPRLRGKWALGITPRNFTWVLKDKLAVCERPGGYGENHRRVRRQEEIIWVRENGFGCLISIIPAPHNLHNYEELGVNYRHRPFTGEDLALWLKAFYTELHALLDAGVKVPGWKLQKPRASEYIEAEHLAQAVRNGAIGASDAILAQGSMSVKKAEALWSAAGAVLPDEIIQRKIGQAPLVAAK
jgi:hypothetical protein